MLHRIHYISQGTTVESQEKDIQEALEAGCKLIQLRFKNGTHDEIVEVARRAKVQCAFHEAKLLINDHVEIAREVDADGVHLGLEDMSVADARKLLGPEKMIGGTANSLADVLQRVDEHCDYVGLGPFAFTTTKEKLSPILGKEGYEQLFKELKDRQVTIPVYAIGGITLDDITDLKACGVYGIALSGLISNALHKGEIVREIEKRLHY